MSEISGTNYCIASVICGFIGFILGMILTVPPLGFWIGFVDPFFGISAIILGGLALRRDESLGAVGIVLGIIDLFLVFVLWGLIWVPWFWF